MSVSYCIPTQQYSQADFSYGKIVLKAILKQSVSDVNLTFYNECDSEFLIRFEAWAKLAQQWLVCAPLVKHFEPINNDLTLSGLSLFFKILPISNTGDSIAYILATVHFLYPKLGSFSDMEYYFYQLAYRDSKVPKCFVGLNQMQCSPSFDWNWGKQNDPTACWHQLHPRFRVLQQGKCLRYPPERVGGITETTNCVGGEGA